MRDRQRHDELMDQTELDQKEHLDALRGLGRVNVVSGSASILWKPIAALARGRGQENPIRVLDVACGGGDLAIALTKKARTSGLDIQFAGCDRSMQVIEFARSQAKSENLTIDFFQKDALADLLPPEYDIILCTLFLHHLEPGDATRLLRNFRDRARQLVLVDDLIRSRLGYLLAYIGCRLLSRSRIVHYDGPVSVQGAYTVSEVVGLASAADMTDCTIQRHWPQRFLLTWRRPQ